MASNIRNIFDRNGKLLGYTVDRDTEIHAFASTGKLVGRYQRSTDTTWDGMGRMVSSSGDLTSALISESYYNH